MPYPKNFKKLFRLFYALLFLLVLQVKLNATIYYVKPTATGSGNASSWANAIGSLQSVLNIAHSGDQIWVATGSYIAPTAVSGPITYNSFVLKFDGVEIYGGFVGTETLLSQRNYELNETKLVGNGNVVLKSNVTLTRNTKLDGFSIINGSQSNSIEMSGGIDINLSSSPTIQHCKFYNNTSTNNGGAIAVSNSASPLILDCIFYNNTGTNGGAINVDYYSNPIILNCSFYNNTATSGNGNAIFISSSVQAGKISKISNSIVFGNGTNEIYESTAGYLTVDYSNIKGGYSGTGNIDADPKFVNPSAGNLKLPYNSPSVQTGDNNSYNALANINTNLDLAGNARLSANAAGTASIIDMGAYQFVPIAPTSLTYSSPNFYTANVSSVNLTPTSDGTPPLTYSIDKSLPVGLTFNTNTGAITGIPSQIFSPTIFTITTSNSLGTASTTVHITVNDKLPNLSYTSPVIYTTGETISPTLSPLNSGGVVTGGLIAKQTSETLGYNGIAGLVMDNVGNFYFLSDVAHVIYKRTPGGVVTLFASGFLGANSIAIDPNNIIYVTTNTQVLKVDIGGNVSTLTQNGNLSYAQGIKYGSDGYLYVAEYQTDKVIKVDPNTGAQTVFASNLSPSLLAYQGPKSLIFNSAGDLIVFNGDATISKVSTLGVVTQRAISTSSDLINFGGPKDVTIDGEGNIYVAGYQSSVKKINTIGDVSNFADLPTSGPHLLFGIHFGLNGELYVLNRNFGTNNSILYKFNKGKYQITPDLPAGLTFDTNTGVISGTAAAISPSTNYTIAAVNSAGTFSTTINLEVKGLIVYTTPNVFTKLSPITTLTPNTNGVVANSFTISPSLPTGLNIDATTGAIGGTATVISPLTEYTVTAVGTSGNLLGRLEIKVNDIAPSALSYSSPNVYTRGTTISNLTPTVSGGAVTNYSITPTLPPGLTLNATTGVISGTPTIISPSTTYTITATNSGGATTSNIDITVNDVAPNTLGYITPNTFSKGVVITNLLPIIAEGTVVTLYTITPALPAGLSFNATTGVISGTPTIISPSSTYTITASNSGGAASTNIVITVNDIAPSGLSYTTPNIFTKDKSITSLTPIISGGVVINYSIVPSLPTGLVIDQTTGVISGTPTIISPSATYTITATNSGGAATANINITVNDIAPSGLSYTTPNIFTKNRAITSLTPTISGGTVINYSIAPGLPTGLVIDQTTGVISGTPTILSTSKTYTITAINSGGTATANINITVNDIAPSGLSYTTPNVYTRGTVISNLTPTVSGGAVINYSIVPSLPTGLVIDQTTGVISGIPTIISPSATYTITATNSGGTATANINITVNDIAPSGLSYTTPNVYTKGTVISNLNPTVSGGAVTNYSITPTLPSGLIINSSTGVISGTPTLISPSNTYTITATNSGGSATANINITVNDIAPSGLSYTTPNIYYKDRAITSLTPVISGGTVINYSIVPTLPTGLLLNQTTGVISGTPTILSPSTTYTITATNSGGVATSNINIKVMLYLFLKDSVMQQNNCANDSSGSIAVFAQGGYAPYSYSINGGAYQSNGIFVKLKSGIYNLSLKDSTGAIVTAIDTIKSFSPTQIKTSVHAKNNDCFGGQLGAIIVDSVRGGVFPYSYTWSNGDTSSSGISKLAKGDYSLKLKDFYGCQDSVFISIKEADKIVVTSITNSPLCYNECNGSILVSAKGGTGKLSYLWSNGSTLANITNLCSGTYKLTVKDSLSCINNSEIVLNNPLQFKIDLVANATICSNQVYKTDIKDVNYPTANYSWTSANGFASNTSSVSLSKAGTYYVSGTNLNGCTVKDTLVLNMQNSIIESVFAVATNIFQNDTIHIVNISMPRPDLSVWSYPIDNNVQLIYSNQDSIRLKFKEVGTYSVMLKTSLGACKDSSIQQINVVKPSGIAIYNTAPLSLNTIQNLSVAPNPSRGRFTVSMNFQNSSAIVIRILSVSSGKIVFAERYASSKSFVIPIDVALTPDMYTLLVETEFGATAVHKIIIL